MNYAGLVEELCVLYMCNIIICMCKYRKYVDSSFKVWDPWYDLGPSDCNAGECNYDSYRRFVALKQRNPNFKPMISVGKSLYTGLTHQFSNWAW